MTALALLALAIWVVLLLGRGNFWRLAGDQLPAAASQDDRRAILAIVPARDEADILPLTLPALLGQDTPGPFHVIVVDDHSSDGTAERAQALAAACGRTDRLTVVSAAPLPSGWAGKLWAMRCGLAHADAMDDTPPRILFTDADIHYGPGTLMRLAAEAGRRQAVAASLMVRLRAESAAERWLIPPFVYFFRMLYPFAHVADPARRTAAAAGGSMLIERDALAAAGGLEAIRGALIDDVAMGRMMKRAGPIWLGMSADVASVRAYPALGDIAAMVVRSAYAELRYSRLRLAVAMAGLALVFLVPPLATLAGSGWGRLAGALAWAAMTLSFAPMAAFYGVGLWRGALMPAVAVLYGAFTLQSAALHLRGRGGLWKGRLQAGTPNGETA